MALSAGTRLGPYEIQAPLGSGGMGEVYKATDTRLNRTVAIKILPDRISGLDEMKARFDREAQTIASLNHPNICTLHDIGHEGEHDFLVLEFLEGQTLADRLAKGAMPLSEALTVGIAIAEALEKAHRQNVVHRDLKPANVMLTKAGPKLLDFGLAKWAATEGDAIGAMPTRADVTAKGTMLGTLQYMAPEQIEGREADARTDIFAFGELLYEMVTGKKAFEGKSQATLISAIMSRDPTPMAVLAPVSPPALEHLVQRCLEKDADDRWQSAHSLVVQLRWIAYGDSQSPALVVEPASARTRRRVAVAALGVGALAVAALAGPAYRYVRGPAPEAPYSYRMPVRGVTNAAMAPNGSALVFAADIGDGVAALYYRPIRSLTAVRLDGTNNAEQPFFSPDSEDVAFVAGGMLRRVAVRGGAPRNLGTVVDFKGGAWNRQGTILFGSPKGLFRISDQGGAAEPVTTVEAPSTGHHWPAFLPDDKGFVYLSTATKIGDHALMAGTLGSAQQTRLVAVSSRVRYADPGFLVYQRDGAVVAHPFDADSRSFTGEPTQLVPSVRVDEFGGLFDVSNTGVLAYFDARIGGRGGRGGRGAGNENPAGVFSWVRRGGGYVQPVGEPGPWGDIDLSPDGNQIAMTRVDGGAGDIWVLDWRRGPTGVPTRLTIDPANDQNPVWSHDGKRVAFTTYRKGNADIYIKNANNVGDEEPLLATDRFESIEDWARDGSHILYLSGTEEQQDIWAMPLAGDRKPFPVVVGPFRKDEPQFSRDGKWVAFSTEEDTTSEVYVLSFPDLKQREKVSVGGGVQPRWHPDGKTLFYRTNPGRVMAASITTSPQLRVGTPELLFSNNTQPGYTNNPARHQWAVSPDGGQFLLRATHRTATSTGSVVVAGVFNAPGAPTTPTAPVVNPPFGGLTILLNWPSATKKAPQ
jgi:Tol biopolymer transport system component